MFDSKIMSEENLNTHLTSIHKRDVNIYISMLFSVAHAAWVGTYDILILSPFSRRNIKTACYMHTGVIN